MPKERPSFTLSEAVEEFAASRSTLRRRLEAGAFPNAHQEPGTGSWRIPVTDLLAAGFKPRKTWLTDTLTERAHPESDTGSEHAQQLLDRVKTLERDLAIERAHREAAERIAAAEANRAETAIAAMRMLENTTGPPAPHTRRRWWARMK